MHVYIHIYVLISMTSGTTSFCSFFYYCATTVELLVGVVGWGFFLLLFVILFPIDVHSPVKRHKCSTLSEALQCSDGKSKWKLPSDMYSTYSGTLTITTYQANSVIGFAVVFVLRDGDGVVVVVGGIDQLSFSTFFCVSMHRAIT